MSEDRSVELRLINIESEIKLLRIDLAYQRKMTEIQISEAVWEALSRRAS